MKRKLLKQMGNEWKDNVWLVISLTIVCVVIWAIGMLLYAQCKGLLLPKGFDVEGVYGIWVDQLEPTEYEDGEPDTDSEDLKELIKELKKNPHVAEVALAVNGLPYDMSFYGNLIYINGDPDSLHYYGNIRRATPEIASIIGIESRTGSSTEELVAMLERGEILLSDNSYYNEKGGDWSKLKGRKATGKFNGFDNETRRIGDVIRNVRRNDYETPESGTIIYPVEEKLNPDFNQCVTVRVKPGQGKAFVEDFRSDHNLHTRRNVYLYSIKDVKDLRRFAQNDKDVQLRFLLMVVAFLLITIFLGLLGTFYFRIQQRVQDIAIREVCGASKRQIFRRILAEGMLLLLMATLLAAAIAWPIARKYLDAIQETWQSCLVIGLIAVGIVALFIILGVLSPALRAMKIEPAQAMRDN